MAHFAQLDEENYVLQVIVLNDNDLLDVNGIEQEAVGIEFCKKLLGPNTRWAQTSFNGNFRKNYAGIGFFYDSVNNAFIPPKPFNDWVLNESTYQWVPPIPYPSDGQLYNWNQESQTWVPC